MELSVAGQTIEMEATGAYDADAQRMSMEMDMGAMFEELAGTTGETVPAGLDEPMQVVADGSTMYMKAPMLESRRRRDRVGVAVRRRHAARAAMGFGSYDPSEILESLRGVTGEPEVVGTETVRGVETTRYSATMDLERALAEAPRRIASASRRSSTSSAPGRSRSTSGWTPMGCPAASRWTWVPCSGAWASVPTRAR